MSINSFKVANLQLFRRAILLGYRMGRPVSICNNEDTKCFVHNSSVITEERRAKFSYNAEVLRAVDCNVSRSNLERKNETKKSTTESKTSKDDLDDNFNNKNNNPEKRILFILAAALGIAGLVYYFMGSNKNENVSTKEDNIVQRKPTSSEDLPKHIPYLLIGGGTSAFSAFRAIKSSEARAKVLIITAENRNPYMRPPLSKELWYSAKDTQLTNDYRFKQWTGTERSLYFEPEEFFVEPSQLKESEKGGIAVAQGFIVKKIDPVKQIVTLSDGYEISYDKCLLATGCRPKKLPVFANSMPSILDKVMVYRTPEDFERLKSYVDRKKNVAIIGNGFIGSELACSLANYSKDNNNSHIFQIFPEKGNMSKVLPDYLSSWTMKKIQSQGVHIVSNAYVKSVDRDNSAIKLTLSTGETIVSDIVVVCVGCEANTDLASISDLEVDTNLGGFVVNAELEARRNLFVAGDASCFYDPLLGRRRVEHHDHSVVSGRLAGDNMVGKKKPYAHQSMFWSDLGPEIGYEGIGLVDSSLPTVGVFELPSKGYKTGNLAANENFTQEKSVGPEIKTSPHIPNSNADSSKPEDTQNSEYGRGVVFYLKDDKIVGILLWNIFNRIGLARTIIKQHKKYDDLNELAKLFEIHA